jgi:cytidylate kinase
MRVASRPVPETSLAGVVALDGPSGTGKSTVARALARRLDARYLDSGAMYRAVTALVLRSHVDPGDAAAVCALLPRADLRLSTDPDDQVVSVAGADVTDEIRGAAVTAAVSAVSAIAAVRAELVDQQRAMIERALAGPANVGGGGIVVEGRDIASVVWPQADVKVYLTASPEVRAQRRAGELSGAAVNVDTPVDVAAVAADLARRDGLDSTRAVSPLVRADGAEELDTSRLDVDGVVDAIVELIAARATDQPSP